MATNLVWHEIPTARPSPVQWQFVTDLNQPARAGHFLQFMLGGYGAGKTHALAYKACVSMAVNRGVIGGGIGETLDKLKQDIIPATLAILDWSKVRHRYHKTEYWIEVPAWRSRIKFVTAEEPDRIKGQNWGWAIGNEPGLWPEEAYLNTLARIRVPCRASHVSLAGTPEGFNWLQRESVKKYPRAALGIDPFCRVWFTGTDDAVWLPETYMQTLVGTYADDLIAEKIKGQFVLVGVGRLYPNFDLNRNVRECRRDRRLRLTLALDFNVAPAIALVHQHRPHPELGTVVECLDEIHIARGTTADVIEEFVARWAGDIDTGDYVVEVIGDATGNSQHATGAICYDEVFRVLGEHGIGFEQITPASNPPRKDRYAIVNGALYHGRYVIDPRCEFAIEDFAQTTYKPGTTLPDPGPNGERTHLSDAAGYDLHATFAVGISPTAPEIVRQAEPRPWSAREPKPWSQRSQR